mgnify:CR=1 FL=1
MSGGRVGLLGGQPALLDREVRPVAGGIDIVDPHHLPVIVDRDEATVVARQTPQVATLDQRQSYGRAGIESALPRSEDDSLRSFRGAALALVLDSTHGQELGHRIARHRPEENERGLLGRHDDERYPRPLERYTTMLLPEGVSDTTFAPEAAPVGTLESVTVPIRGSRRARRSRAGCACRSSRLCVSTTPEEAKRRLGRHLSAELQSPATGIHHENGECDEDRYR